MRNGTFSRNFLTRTLLLDSVRSRIPCPSQSAFVSLPMSLSWIQIRILDGFMFITGIQRGRSRVFNRQKTVVNGNDGLRFGWWPKTKADAEDLLTDDCALISARYYLLLSFYVLTLSITAAITVRIEGTLIRCVSHGKHCRISGGQEVRRTEMRNGPNSVCFGNIIEYLFGSYRRSHHHRRLFLIRRVTI